MRDLQAAAQCVQYGQRLPKMDCRLTALQFDHETDAHPCGCGQLILAEALRDPCEADDGSDLFSGHGGSSRSGRLCAFCGPKSINIPDREDNLENQIQAASIFPIGKTH